METEPRTAVAIAVRRLLIFLSVVGLAAATYAIGVLLILSGLPTPISWAFMGISLFVLAASTWHRRGLIIETGSTGGMIGEDVVEAAEAAVPEGSVEADQDVAEPAVVERSVWFEPEEAEYNDLGISGEFREARAGPEVDAVDVTARINAALEKSSAPDILLTLGEVVNFSFFPHREAGCPVDCLCQKR